MISRLALAAPRASILDSRFVAALWLGLLLAGCEPGFSAVDGSAAVAASRQAIVNGIRDTLHPEVGILYGGTQTACTATLIGERTAITAAHCVLSAKPPYTLLKPVTFVLQNPMGKLFLASRVVAHPDYAGGNRADLAIVQLDRTVDGIRPARLSERGPVVGDSVVLVGFGQTQEGEGSFGEKRKAQNAIALVQDEIFRMRGAQGAVGNVCNGDSGGPTFIKDSGNDDRLLGVHSTKGGACGHEGNDIRLDKYRAWIAAEAGSDLYDGHSVDDQAPRAEIEVPVAGATISGPFVVHAIASDNHFVARVSLLVDGHAVGQLTAAPYAFDVPDLAPGPHELTVLVDDGAGLESSTSITVRRSGAEALTARRVPPAELGLVHGATDYGRFCEGPLDCASGLCASDAATGHSFCTLPCDASQASTCPEDATCQPAGEYAVCSLSEQARGLAAVDGSLDGGCSVSSARAAAATDQPRAALFGAILAALLAVRFARTTRRPVSRR